MKKVFYLTVLLNIFFSCEDQINVTLEREPGSISGQILPKGVGAVVGIYQGPLIQEVNTDGEGYFRFSNLSAGTYTIRAKAPNYGTREIVNVQVEDSEGYDIGQIQLYEYPAPLISIFPLNGEIGVRYSRGYRLVTLYFD